MCGAQAQKKIGEKGKPKIKVLSDRFGEAYDLLEPKKKQQEKDLGMAEGRRVKIEREGMFRYARREKQGKRVIKKCANEKVRDKENKSKALKKELWVKRHRVRRVKKWGSRWVEDEDLKDRRLLRVKGVRVQGKMVEGMGQGSESGREGNGIGIQKTTQGGGHTALQMRKLIVVTRRWETPGWSRRIRRRWSTRKATEGRLQFYNSNSNSSHISS